MPNFETIHNEIRKRFKNEVQDSTEMPVQLDAVIYDNAPEDTPKSATAWIRFSVMPGDSMQVDIAESRRFRNPGVAIAQIFVPLERGDALALQIADHIVSKFRAKATTAGITYRTASVRRVGRTGQWWQINVICPFYADDFS